jgi:pimeloyl-ACP methyl ester carboxylesterase
MGSRQLTFDIDIFRKAIGAEQLSFIGLSYGTMVAGAYASVFPEKVDKMILNGVINPDSDVRSMATMASAGINQYWNGIANACQNSLIDGSPEDEVCPAASNLHGVTSKVYEMINDASNLDRAVEVINLVYLQTLDPGATKAATVMACIEEAYSGVKQPGCFRPTEKTVSIIQDEDRFPPDLLHGVSGIIHGVRAMDTAGRLNEESYIEWWRSTKDLYPIGAVVRGALEAKAIGVWPGLESPMPPLGAENVAPLIIGNLHDAQTAYSGAQEMHKVFPASSLMTWQGYGHCFSLGTALQMGPKEVVSTYLKDLKEGRLPEYTDDVAMLLCSKVVHNYLKTGKLPRNGHLCKAAGPVKLGYKQASRFKGQRTPGVGACLEGTVPRGGEFQAGATATTRGTCKPTQSLASLHK